MIDLNIERGYASLRHGQTRIKGLNLVKGPNDRNLRNMRVNNMLNNERFKFCIID